LILAPDVVREGSTASTSFPSTPDEETIERIVRKVLSQLNKT
jgi:hypothetical protein